MNNVIINNLKRAIEIFEAVPEERVDLDYWAFDPALGRLPGREGHTCNTLYCGAGWLATEPYFLHQLEDIFGAAIFAGWGFTGLANAMSFRNEMFGEGCRDRLFHCSGSGNFDDEILEKDREDETIRNPLSDKDLLLARFRMQLKIYEEAA